METLRVIAKYVGGKNDLHYRTGRRYILQVEFGAPNTYVTIRREASWLSRLFFGNGAYTYTMPNNFHNNWQIEELAEYARGE